MFFQIKKEIFMGNFAFFVTKKNIHVLSIQTVRFSKFNSYYLLPYNIF